MQKQKKCGENLLKINHNLFFIFLLTLLSRVGTNGVIIVLVIQIFNLDSTGASSSIINVLFLLGASLIGLGGSKFLNQYKGFTIGFYSPLISALLCILFIMVNSNNLGAYYIFAFLIALLGALETPNNNATIPELIKEETNLSKYYSIHQTIDYTLLLILPIIINFSLKYISFDFIYIILALFFIAGCVPWIFIKNYIFYKNPTNENSNIWKETFKGYYIIYKDKSLLLLNLTRLFNNMIFSVTAVGIPFLISYLSGGNMSEVIDLKTFYEMFVSISFIIISLIFTIKLLDNKYTINIMAISTPVVVFIAYILLYATKSPLFFYTLGISIGIGQYFGRISTITIGQKITQRSDLPIVILAGDTVTRIFTLGLTSLMIFLLNSYNSYLFEILGISYLIGLVGLTTIIVPLKTYHKEMNKFETT